MISEKNNTVLIVDDHPLIQMGVSSLFKRNNLFKTIDLASTGSEAVGFLKALQSSEKPPYNLIVADINLPDYEISNLLKIFKDRAPDTKILILSMESPKLYLQNLINEGIDGFISKNASDDDFIYAVNKILSGKTHFTGESVQEMVNSQVVSSSWNKNLSRREHEILALMLKGIPPKEICQIANLHKSSVTTYKTRIYSKLGVKNSLEFFQWATKEKILIQ